MTDTCISWAQTGKRRPQISATPSYIISNAALMKQFCLKDNLQLWARDTTVVEIYHKHTYILHLISRTATQRADGKFDQPVCNLL